MPWGTQAARATSPASLDLVTARAVFLITLVQAPRVVLLTLVSAVQDPGTASLVCLVFLFCRTDSLVLAATFGTVVVSAAVFGTGVVSTAAFGTGVVFAAADLAGTSAAACSGTSAGRTRVIKPLSR